MQTIGIIGGMSWESTAEYYRLLNEGIRARLGGLHSAKILLYSVDFAEVEALQRAQDWQGAASVMIEAALRVELGGADCLLMATNTMHKLADTVQAEINIPLIHIADPTATAIQRAGLSRIGLLGTRFTMEGDFYAGRLANRFGLQVLIPGQTERQQLHDIIYHELCLGLIRDESRAIYQAVITDLAEKGAQGVILGCTEIGLLIGPDDSSLPCFDTTRLHVEAAIDWALA